MLSSTASEVTPSITSNAPDRKKAFTLLASKLTDDANGRSSKVCLLINVDLGNGDTRNGMSLGVNRNTMNGGVVAYSFHSCSSTGTACLNNKACVFIPLCLLKPYGFIVTPSLSSPGIKFESTNSCSTWSTVVLDFPNTVTNVLFQQLTSSRTPWLPSALLSTLPAEVDNLENFALPLLPTPSPPTERVSPKLANNVLTTPAE